MACYPFFEFLDEILAILETSWVFMVSSNNHYIFKQHEVVLDIFSKLRSLFPLYSIVVAGADNKDKASLVKYLKKVFETRSIPLGILKYEREPIDE